MIIKLLRSARGNVTVEFALVAPTFLAMLFLTIEGGRMVWTNQALKDVAFSTARCMSVDATRCDTDAKRQAYAIARASLSRIPLVAANVTIQSNVTCDSNVAQNKVTVTKPFGSPVASFFPSIANDIVTHACFPQLVAS